MDKGEWEQIANSYLDFRDIQDECATEISDAHCEPTRYYQNLLEQMKEQYGFAKLAFPGMSFDEFLDLYDSRTTPKKMRGGQQKNPSLKAGENVWRAARDADRLRGLWKKLHPGNRLPRKPILPEVIAAERNGVLDNDGVVDVDAVITAVRRPASRRWDKKRATEL